MASFDSVFRPYGSSNQNESSAKEEKKGFASVLSCYHEPKIEIHRVKVARQCPHCRKTYYANSVALRPKNMPFGKLCKNVFEDDEIEDEPKRKKGKKLKYSLNEDVYISFDLNGYIIEAKGFGFLMWSSNIDIDKELIGKNIDELSKMLDKNCINREVYLRFETDVHVDLLKEMLQYKGAIDD